MKNCSNKNCKQKNPQPLENFAKNKRNKDKLQSRCRTCTSSDSKNHHKKNIDKIRQYKKEYNKKHPSKRKELNLKNKFGISLEIYNNMLLTQNNCCSICKINILKVKKQFAVDHDHNTGKIRDLLCNDCNALLGFCKESINILSEAINYIKKHSSVENCVTQINYD